jgi:hypothetical protein
MPFFKTWEEEQEWLALEGLEVTSEPSTNGRPKLEGLDVTREPSTEPAATVAGGSPSLQELHEQFQRYLYLPDLVAIDVAAAAVVAHRAGGDPLWLQFVSPPSSGKTEILQSLTDCPEVYKLSSLTGQTFVSGFQGAVVQPAQPA